jgi:hypothetical protein
VAAVAVAVVRRRNGVSGRGQTEPGSLAAAPGRRINVRGLPLKCHDIYNSTVTLIQIVSNCLNWQRAVAAVFLCSGLHYKLNVDYVGDPIKSAFN